MKMLNVSYSQLQDKLGLLTRSVFCFMIIGVVLVINQPAALAFTQCELDEIRNGTAYFNGCKADCPPVDTSTTSTSNTATGSADGYPIKLPAIKDSAKLASAIDAYIAKNQPSSPMKNMGKYFVQGGMRAGINPLLVVAHAQHESGFGTASSKFNSAGAHNAFGRTAGGDQPGVDTGRKWYKWDSWEASLYAPTFPASGKNGQPDDQFQYIARRYANNLTNGLKTYLEGDPAKSLPGYAPSSDGNNVAAYMTAIQTTTQTIADASGGAIDLAQFGTASTDSTTAPADPAATAAAANQTVIALDPGHGAVVPEYVDPVTGLGDRETDNSPERENVQDVANQVKTALEQAGYKVVMLKTGATDAVSKRQRVDAARAANADMAVSIHTDSGSGTFEGWAEVWPQFVNGYRESVSDASKKVVFTNAETADKSSSYADIFAKERDAAERKSSGVTKKVVGQGVSFAKSRGLPSFGDLSLVQLWADDIPWVYNEAGAPAGGLTTEQKAAYAQGIINGVEKSLPAAKDGSGTTGDTSGCSGGSSQLSVATGNGNSVSTALLYAWPHYRGSKTAEALAMKPEYEAAINLVRKAGYYIGGIKYPGVDCGGFVTRVMIDSGYEPGYNNTGLSKNGAGATGTQLAWIRKNWNSVGRGDKINTGDLKPGDVAFRVTSSGGNDGHTFMYVGKQPGFDSVIASASLDGRAPVAGKENPAAGNIEWFRKK